MRAFCRSLVVAVFSLCLSGYAASSNSADVAAINSLEKNFAAAFEAKDVARIMSVYAPGKQLLVFDMVVPRAYPSHEAYTKDWEEFLKTVDGPLKVDVSDLDITTNGSDLAFSHSIQRVSGKSTDGKPLDITVRVTDVYRKLNGKWLIVHEHVSVPIDMATGKPDMQSKP